LLKLVLSKKFIDFCRKLATISPLMIRILKKIIGLFLILQIWNCGDGATQDLLDGTFLERQFHPGLKSQ